MYNGPESVLTYLYNAESILREKSKKTVAVKNEGGCLSNPSQSSCQITDSEQSILLSQIRFVYSSPATTAPPSGRYIVIADTRNHCIRVMDNEQKMVKTIAGICGESGFKDGPLHKNRLNSPNSLGLDNYGNIWIYDSGNSYIRLLKILGNNIENLFEGALLYTMIKGVCRDCPDELKPLDSQIIYRYSLCYEKWIKTEGYPDDHIFDQSYLDNFCTDHFESCEQFQGKYLFYEGVKLYNSTLIN